MKKIYSTILIFIFSISASAQTYTFSETQGGKEKSDINWDIKKTNWGQILTEKTSDRTTTYEINSDGSNRLWKVIIPSEKTDFSARVEDAHIKISGNFKGKPIEKSYKIGKIIWVQSPAYTLSRVCKVKGRKTLVYYTVKPENLELEKMRAERVETEFVKINGKDIESFRVKVTYGGIILKMWNSSYYYRKSDLVYIKYEGKQGNLDMNSSIITLKIE